jgi:hypothetical protein
MKVFIMMLAYSLRLPDEGNNPETLLLKEINY